MNTTSRRRCPEPAEGFEHRAKFFTENCGTLTNEADMTTQTQKSHMPKNSILFEKIVPITLILLGLITLGLMIFAAGVLLGFVRF